MVSVGLLYTAYVINILVLNTSIGYVLYVYVTDKFYGIENPFIRGWRVFPAMLLPMIWLVYVISDCYHATNYIMQNSGKLDASVVIDKATREWLDTIGTLINALFLSGYEPKNKDKWER